MLSLSLLQCLGCHGALSTRANGIRCEGCGCDYAVHKGVPVFVPDARTHAVASHQQQSRLRRALRVFRPPHHSVYFATLSPSYGEGRELQQFLAEHGDLTVLNIGSLSMSLRHLHPRIINLDISYYANVDVVADAHRLPFRDGSVDVVLFKNVLEHIRDPARAMGEIRRVLKAGGVLYIKLPFLQPFHAVPDDYQRYTVSGMKELLRGYEELEFGISVGPASMFCWTLREYLAVLTSFGRPRLYETGVVVWGWLTFWLKYGDILFRGNKLANRVSSAFYGFYRKA